MSSTAASSRVPHHIAIVMDGNGRWAKKRFLPRLAGHKKGVDALRDCVSHCKERGVRVLTVFAFSSENWNRPEDEVSGLMTLMSRALHKEAIALNKNGVRLLCIGDRQSLSPAMQKLLQEAEDITAQSSDMLLNICFNYGGRWDIAHAAEQLRQQNRPITVEELNQTTALSHCGDPDLIIRTGGEMRLSNFLLWQAAYAELYFSETLWPDYSAKDLDAAIESFSSRQRRFGKTSEQIEQEQTQMQERAHR